LNRLLGLRLAVDGVLGAQTRSAIRSFQQRRSLLVDGVVGAQTEAALRAAGASAPPAGTLVMPPLTITVRPFVVLDRFAFDDAAPPTFHDPIIERIARLVVASRVSAEPIDTIRLVGHTDPTGPAAYNVDLATRRANQVKAKLVAAIGALGPVPAGPLDIVAQSVGESQPVAPNTAAGRALNRRVAVYLPNTCQTFFAQYDLRFLPGDPVFGIPAHPNLTPAQKQQRSDDVTAMVAELVRRRDLRASEALQGRAPPSNPVPAGALRDSAVRLSSAQLDLYREYFPDGTGGIDFVSFQTCFERFANGELRSPIAADQAAGVGEPNGGFFFLFAEFAFLCIGSGIAAAEWTQALRAFVKAQEIFMHVYRPSPVSPPPAADAPLPACPRDRQGRPRARRRLDDYRNANFSPTGAAANVGAGQSNQARKQALGTKYASADLPALGREAQSNMLRAQCMP
jgi:hypothetical protein